MATKTISIHGVKVEVSQPYEAGQTIDALAAKALNQVRAENVANNFRKAIAEAKDDEAKLAGVLAEFAEYEKQYTFAQRGEGRAPLDPIERAALTIGKEYLAAKIKETLGLSVKKYLESEENKAKYEANLEKIIVTDEVLKLARERVKQAGKVANLAFESAV